MSTSSLLAFNEQDYYFSVVPSFFDIFLQLCVVGISRTAKSGMGTFQNRNVGVYETEKLEIV